MKKYLLAAILISVNFELFATESCPQVIRHADLEIIATLKEKDTFEMKGDTWTVTLIGGDWQRLLGEDALMGDQFDGSSIIFKNNQEILQCRYSVWLARDNQYHGFYKKVGGFHIETIIKD